MTEREKHDIAKGIAGGIVEMVWALSEHTYATSADMLEKIIERLEGDAVSDREHAKRLP